MTDNYHFSDIRVAETPEPTQLANQHRQLGQELAGLTEDVLRLDASEQELAGYIQQIQQLRQSVRDHGQRDYNQILQRLMAGTASSQDVTDLVDFEILSGKASPMSPPLELWLDGDTVRGRAQFGAAFQGPPGRVHGGVLSLALDMVLAKTQDFVKQIGMTGTLNIRYMAPTPLNAPVEFEARLVGLERRKLLCEGSVWVKGQQTVAVQGVWISARGDYALKDSYAGMLDH